LLITLRNREKGQKRKGEENNIGPHPKKITVTSWLSKKTHSEQDNVSAFRENEPITTPGRLNLTLSNRGSQGGEGQSWVQKN